MSAKKDALEVFHEHGVHLPTRTILLDTSLDDDGDADGVNHAMSTKFIKNFYTLSKLSKDPITVLLNTHGGKCIEGMAIYDLIRSEKNIFVTIKVIGQACSMGCLILQAGDERVIMPHAPIMCHAGSGGQPDFNPLEVFNSAEFDKKWTERMWEVLLERINEKRQKDNKALMSKRGLTDLLLRGKYMFAEEAVELGLADRIEETH